MVIGVFIIPSISLVLLYDECSPNTERPSVSAGPTNTAANISFHTHTHTPVWFSMRASTGEEQNAETWRRKKKILHGLVAERTRGALRQKKWLCVDAARKPLDLVDEKWSHCAREEFGKCAKTRRSLLLAVVVTRQDARFSLHSREVQSQATLQTQRCHSAAARRSATRLQGCRQHVRFRTCAVSARPLVRRPQCFLTRSEWSFHTSVLPKLLWAENKTGYNLKHTDK